MIGRTIAGRYEVQGLLGKGGFGAVFAARHSMTGQDVVLKVMRPELALDPTQVKRFMNEARISSQLSHPNTVRTFDFGQTDDGLLYLVMERLHGDELARVLRRDAPLDPVRAMHIAIGVLKSLSEAHAAGLVHRDLKPGNIFLVNVHGEDDFVKLIDFGIAKSVEGGDDDLTRTGMAIGTPKYMSPEQGRAEPLDGRSDLYALGVILFEMLSARLPFEATSAMSMIVKHLQEAPPDLRTLAPQGVPPDLAAVVMRALKKSPWERFRDADEMREQLESILEGMGALHKRRTVSSKIARATIAPEQAGDAAAVAAAAASQDAAPTMDVDAARAALAADETRALAADSAPAKPAGGARPPSSAEVAALAAAFDREAASGQPTGDVAAADELDQSTFVPSEAETASEAKAAAAAATIDAPARAAVASKPPPGVRPQTPTRPAGPTTSHVEPRKPTPAWVFFLGFVVVAAVGGWVWWTQIASDEARSGVTREVAAARATVETKVNEPGMAKAGQRRKDHGKPKGSKAEPKTVAEKLKAAVVAGADKVGEALPGGDEPQIPGVKPLESDEVDKVARGAAGAIKKCIYQHGKPNTRYTRMGASLIVGKDGRVREAEAVADLAEGELAKCVEAAFERLRFRSGLDREQSIQAFVAFLPITAKRSAKPTRRAGSAGDQPL
ncbi:MAG: serine/threonine protein kinase [Deltaproteobacteria bacterium]|nr:serine/threonine protein kinase [Deltaproteobacteria bacterium]